MIYISERLTNLSELESAIDAAAQAGEELRRKIKSARAPIDQIDTLASDLCGQLQRLKNFELCVERRKTVYPDANSDRP
ncbi:MAG: hypothetical protein LUC35_00195 [Clostridiales bacterium]|nr:hypothetical protein [Clostridiales bacterium]